LSFPHHAYLTPGGAELAGYVLIPGTIQANHRLAVPTICQPTGKIDENMLGAIWSKVVDKIDNLHR
jgi:hypothetical protein